MPYTPLSGYTIDGYDLYGTWKINVRKITGLYSFLARKGETFHSWLDSDGVEAYTLSTDIYFEARDNIFMFCWLWTSSFDLAHPYGAFGGFLESFRSVLEAAGTRSLIVPYSDKIFTLMYVKGSDVEMQTPPNAMGNTDAYIGDFWIQFKEPTPTRG